MLRIFLIIAAVAFTLIGPLVYARLQLAIDLAVGERWTVADDLAIKEFRLITSIMPPGSCLSGWAAR